MQIAVSTTGFELSSELERYAHTKITQLLKVAPKAVRMAARCTVVYEQAKNSTAKTCRVTLQVNGRELIAEESTQHPYAALDIAVVHLDHQLRDLLGRDHGRAVKRGVRADWPLP